MASPLISGTEYSVQNNCYFFLTGTFLASFAEVAFSGSEPLGFFGSTISAFWVLFFGVFMAFVFAEDDIFVNVNTLMAK
jgi:hypothetical protein